MIGSKEAIIQRFDQHRVAFPMFLEWESGVSMGDSIERMLMAPVNEFTRLSLAELNQLALSDTINLSSLTPENLIGMINLVHTTVNAMVNKPLWSVYNEISENYYALIQRALIPKNDNFILKLPSQVGFMNTDVQAVIKKGYGQTKICIGYIMEGMGVPAEWATLSVATTRLIEFAPNIVPHLSQLSEMWLAK